MLRSNESGCREDGDLPVLGPITAGNRASSAATMPGMTRIADEVTAWPGVTAGPGRARRVLVQGRRSARSATCTATACAHFGFPKAVWHELYDAGRIDYHPVFPGKPGFGARATSAARTTCAT